MTRNRHLRALLGVAIATVTVFAATPAGAAPAGAEGPAGGRSVQRASFPAPALAQIPLTHAADTIREAIDGAGAAGYAGLELGDKQVVLWWKGTLPAAVGRAVGRARTIAPVRVGAAAHSLRDLRAGGARIRAALPGEKPRITYAVDGSRIVVSRPAAVTRAALPAVGVPVDVVEQGTKVLTSRQDDWAPWSSGADQINGNARCTTGFPVRNAANERFILTAGHCGGNGDRITDGTGEFMGTFTADNDGHDLGLVATPGGVEPSMYVGGLDSNTVVRVDGWDWVYPGEYLCQSGGTSAREIGGPVCDLRVEKFNTDAGDAVEARQVDGAPAVRGGDSGGPVYAPSAGGGVIAKGINCYTYVGDNTILGFQDFGTATRDYGIWIAQ